MAGSWGRWLIASSLLLVASGVAAQNKCTAKGQMGGQAFSLPYCEVAFYEGAPSVTIWFSSTPITADERDSFQMSSRAERANGRSLVQLAFCPGAGTAVVSPKGARNVEIRFKHASVNLGMTDQWVFDPTKDKQIKFETLTGDLKRGGKLSGKATGAIAGRKPAFDWDLQFELVLPQRNSGSGPSC